MGEHEEDQGFLIRLTLSVWYEDDGSYVEYLDNDGLGNTVQRVAVITNKVPILRRTAKGVWVKDLNNKERFVLLEGRKRYAYPTMQAAYDSFIVRKRHERHALENRLKAIQKLPRTVELQKQLFNKLIASSNAEVKL